ncbi:MAG: ABC transporter permease [Acidimicrobiales bacterium]
MRTTPTQHRLVDLTRNLLRRELRSRYKRSALGWGWSLLNPLASVAIYTMVFSVILKTGTPVGDPSGLESFPLFLLCGLVPWNLFASSLQAAPETFVGNASIIKKVAFPREALVFASVGSIVVTSAVELSVLAAILLIAGNMVLPWLPLVVVLLAVEAVFVVGVSLMVSVCNVYLRDVKHFVTIFIQLAFYATPIIYPFTLVPVHQDISGFDVPLRALYRCNPMTLFVEAFKDALYELRFPPAGVLLGLVAWAAASLYVGLRVFSRFEPRLAEEL